MNDLRSIDRDELLATIREQIDVLTEQGTQEALNGNAQGCILSMHAAGIVEALWDEIRALTKHTPSAPHMAEPGELL
jgi:hypothetical protein